MNRLIKGSKKAIKFASIPVEMLYDIGEFFTDSVKYFFLKLNQISNFAKNFTFANIQVFTNVKFYTVSKFIRSGGRLGYNFRYAFVICFAFAIFLSGNVFQDRLVEESIAQSDFFYSGQTSVLFGEESVLTQRNKSFLLDEPLDYEVKEGDTLDTIGREFGISIETLKYTNDLASNYVKTGQKLTIPKLDGTTHEVKSGTETIEQIARTYNVNPQTIVDFNYIDAPYDLKKGQILMIPDARITDTERFYAGSNVYDSSAYGIIPYAGPIPEGTGTFLWPVSGVLTQGFHAYHPAIDLASPTGTAIVSADKGKIIRAGWWTGGYGNAVQIDHGNGYISTYAHMSVISVSTGEDIEKGQKIGEIGSTGRSTGPHLHLTIQIEGKYLNPLTVL